MEIKPDTSLIAAILTLSEGLDAVHEVMRRNLSYNVELQDNKILEKFIPRPLRDTSNRFNEWKQEIAKSKV